MFKRVGKEIRVWAKVLVILQMIPIVLAGIVCAIAGFTYDVVYGVLGIIAGILFIVLGYLLVRLSAIILYSWGELVERVVCIDEKLEKMNRAASAAPAVPAAPAPFAPPAYSYKPAVHTPVVTPTPVKAAPVVNTPASSISVDNDPFLEDDYTQAAVSRPAPVKAAAPAEWTCPNCGQANSADGSWCRNCGTKKAN